ncbi:MAG: carboxypeptidase regulatory-like domain-containing protein [bacterium]
MRVAPLQRSVLQVLFLSVLALAACAFPARADEIKGTVLDLNGDPVVDASMDAYDVITGQKLFSDNTDALGRYSLLVPGGGDLYDVRCMPSQSVLPRLSPQMKRGIRVAVLATVDFSLPVAAEVLGRVRRAVGGTAVDSCDIDFDRTDDGTRQPAQGDLTNFLGTFRAFVEPTNYTVSVTPLRLADSSLAPVRIFGFQAPDLLPDGSIRILEFSLPRASFLSGTIRDSNGNPVPGAALKFDETTTGRRMPSRGALSAANGFFRIAVAPGNYRVTVEPRVGSNLAAIRVSNVDLTTHRAQDFTLAVGVVVTGRVTDRRGSPIAEADWDAISEDTGLGAATPGDNTAPDGTYRYVVPPGLYRLRVTPPVVTGLDSVTFRNVRLVRDTTINVDYAALDGGGGTGVGPFVRFAPLGNPTRTTASLALVVNRAVTNGLVELYDVGGRRVRVLHDGPMAAGTQSLVWDGRRSNGAKAHTGVYFVRAQLDGFERVTRFVLLPDSAN